MRYSLISLRHALLGNGTCYYFARVDAWDRVQRHAPSQLSRLDPRERTGGSVVVGWSARTTFELIEACLIPRSHAISLIDRKTLESNGFLENPILVDTSGSLIPLATFFHFFFCTTPNCALQCPVNLSPSTRLMKRTMDI